MDILKLDAQIGLIKKVNFNIKKLPLGNNYTQHRYLPEKRSITWEVKTGFLNQIQNDELIDRFNRYNGVTEFKWLPTPTHNVEFNFICKSWSSDRVSIKSYIVSAQFEQTNVAITQTFQFNIDISTVAPKLLAAWQFIQIYTRDTLPNFANSLGLPLNDFMSKPGRRNYFPDVCGTTEALFLIITAILKLLKRFNDLSMLNYAVTTMNNAIPILYKKDVPTNTNERWLPHWLYTGRGQAEIKGSTVTPNFLQSGVFNAVINFNNGIGQLPTNLANVYKVHNGTLLWLFVYAPLISGVSYPIDYYIDKYNRKVNSNDDTLPNDTGLTPGKIKLISNFTGQLKVVYSFYTGQFVPNNSPIEAFPMWRATLTGDNLEINHAFDVSFWANETYNLLKRFNNSDASKWQRAIDANINSTLIAGNVVNESYVFKVDNSTTDPSSYVGVQLILINNKVAVLERVLSNGWYKVTQQASPLNQYGQCELQNFAIYAIWGRSTYWECNFTINKSAILFWGVSTSSDTSDTTQMYYYPFSCVANTNYLLKRFNNNHFVQWTNKTYWHSTNGDVAIATYQGNGGLATVSFSMQTIETVDRLAAILNINNGGGFAGGVLALLENRPRLPLKFMCKISGNITLKITDGSNNVFYTDLLPQDWQLLTIEQSELKRFNHSNDFDFNNPLIQIEFVTNTIGQISIWFVGEYPKPLPYNSYVFKHLVSCRLASEAVWQIGDCKVENSVLNSLPYNPGVVPFTANYVGTTRVSWTGSPYTGYQDENFYYMIGRQDLSKEVIRFKLASMDSYAANSPSGANWVFRQVYNWARWDSSAPPPYNVFLDIGADPNTGWEGYQHRAIKATAEYWFNSNDSDAGVIVMRFLTGLFQWLKLRQQNGLSIQPPTDYPAPSLGLPVSTYNTPYGAGLILKTAIYANLRGGNAFITCQIIQWMYDYLNAQYVNNGAMSGSWSNGQPSFSYANQQYLEYFPFWHGEIIMALLLLEEQFNNLILPTN